MLLFLPSILLLNLLHYGCGGHIAGVPTDRIEGELTEPDNLVMSWPGVTLADGGKAVNTSEGTKDYQAPR